MIGLDTNILVRYLVQDDPEQSAVASRIFESELSALNKGHICPVVLCEVVWVLERAYGQKKAKLSKVIRTLLLAEFIEVEHRDAVWKALRDFASGKADFSDYLIARINQVCGSSVTLTFDRAAAASPGMFRLAV
jgi:predicted nucleic-acid-binding protein